MSYELVASVVGLTNNYKEVFGTRPGIGKSCLCFRLAYPEFDSYVDNHPSLFALHEFESRAINSNHFIYWGSPVKFFPVRGGDCKVKFHIIEQTVFYQDVTAYPFNHSVTKPDNVENYIKRIAGPIESKGKVSYYSRDALVTGMPPGHAAVNYPSGITRLPRGFIVVFDVSVTGKALDVQCKRVDPILSYLNKHKKKFIIAVTKRDKYSMPSLAIAYELRKKYRTHLVECSALDDLNMEEVLRVLALIVITKKTSGLSDQVTRYHDAAQHVLLRRTSAKSGFKSYIRKRVVNSDERLPSVQLSEEFKECARWIGNHKTGCIFALHVLELYNAKIEQSYADVREDLDMHYEYLEDFVDQRKDIESYKEEMRRWITTYMHEFTRQARTSSVPEPGGDGGSSSVAVVTETSGSDQTGSTNDVTSANTISPPPLVVAPPPAPPAIAKTTPVPEGYHIFESVSKVSKEVGPKQEAVTTTEAVEKKAGPGGEEGENGGGGNEAGVGRESSRRESESHDVEVKEGKDNDDDDEVSTYSLDSMESVYDHDYLNFDPKTNTIWPGTPTDDCSKTKGPNSSGNLLSTQKESNVNIKDGDNLSDGEYDNLQDFTGNQEYMNVSEAISGLLDQKSSTLEAGVVDTSGNEDNKNLVTAATEATGSSYAEERGDKTHTREQQEESGPVPGKETGSLQLSGSLLPSQPGQDSGSPPIPQVSPKPLVKKRNIQASHPPPLTLPAYSSTPPNPLVSSEPSPATSVSSSSSSLSPSSASERSPPSGPKRAKPATPVRRSSLNYKSPSTCVASYDGSQTPPATLRSPPVTAQANSKSQKPVSRSPSIKHRAKLLEKSMSSSDVVKDTEAKAEDQNVAEAKVISISKPDDYSSPNNNSQVNELHSKPPLPVLPEKPYHMEIQVPYSKPNVSTQPPSQTNPSSNSEKDGGEVDSSGHLGEHVDQLAAVRSPTTTTLLPTAVLHLASPVDHSPQDSGTSSTSSRQKRPRLSQIKSKLAQKKEVEVEDERTSEGSEAGSVDEVFSPGPQTSAEATPTGRPNLATIKKRLRGKGSSSVDGDGRTAQSNPQSSLPIGVSPSSSINIPPVPPKPPSHSAFKRGSAPASVINQTLDSDRLNEWNTRRQKRMEERAGNGMEEAPPPLPERTPDMFKALPTANPNVRARDYFNVQLPSPSAKEQATHKPAAPVDSSTVTPNPEEAARPGPKKKKGSYLLTKVKKEDKTAQGETTSPTKKVSSKKEEPAKTKEQKSPTKRASTKSEESTTKKEHTSPIKKVFKTSPVKYPFQKIKNKSQASSKKKDSEVQTKAKFIVISNRPLPTLPGHSPNPSAVPKHTDDDYEDFGFDSVEVDYENYPQLPREAVISSRFHRSQSQEPEIKIHSAPATPIIQGKSQTMGRSSRPVPSQVSPQHPYYIDGYVNSDNLPELSSTFHDRPLPSRPPPAVGGKTKSDDSDYDYPDLRLAGAFSSIPAMRAAMAKYELSKKSFRKPPVESQRTQGSSSLGGARTHLMGDSGRDDDDNFRDRTCSDASSAYVPMDGWFDDGGAYVDSIPQPSLVDVEQLLPPRSQVLKSASDHDIAAGKGGAGAGGEGQGMEEFGTVYMNLPMPEKFSTLPPRNASSQKFHSAASPAHAQIRENDKPVSLDDSHISKYPLTKPRPKMRSATVAAEVPTELHHPYPREAWNKMATPRDMERNVGETGNLPPRNIPRM